MFARFAYPPDELGYAGAATATSMRMPGAIAEIERRARRFDGAWVHLEFLAEVLENDDPLSEEIVETYWIGSDLLYEVDSRTLVTRLEKKLVGQGEGVGGTWRHARARAMAHHSFQVYEVEPWAAQLRSGEQPRSAVSSLNGCRIRSGVVTDVDGEWVTATTQLLAWDGARIVEQAPGLERARWAVDGRTLMEKPPVVGDVVALHWDWVCGVLTMTQAMRIDALEAAQRAAVGLDGRPH